VYRNYRAEISVHIIWLRCARDVSGAAEPVENIGEYNWTGHGEIVHCQWHNGSSISGPVNQFTMLKRLEYGHMIPKWKHKSSIQRDWRRSKWEENPVDSNLS